jgi:6-methylsalicylate decarboxylase
VVDLVLNGTIGRLRDLRLIIPHAGATLPLIAERVSNFARLLAPEVDVRADLGRLHYDLAGQAGRGQLDPLLALCEPDHLHYGSDYPFTPEPIAAAAAAAFDDDFVDALRSNTAQLFATDH